MTGNNSSITNSDALLQWVSDTTADIRNLQKELDTLRKWVQRENDKIGDLASKRGTKPTPLEHDQQLMKQRTRLLARLRNSTATSNKPFATERMQPNETYVYVVPHTHTDLGWLETVEDYYSKCSRV